jgi:hypothetical protein
MIRRISNQLRRWMQRSGIYPIGKGRSVQEAGWPKMGGDAMVTVGPATLGYWPKGFSSDGSLAAEVEMPGTEREFAAALEDLVTRAEHYEAAVDAWLAADQESPQPRLPRAGEPLSILQKAHILDLVAAGDLDALRRVDPAEIDIYRTRNDYGFNALGWALFQANLDAANIILDRFDIDLNRVADAAYGGSVASPLHLACAPCRYVDAPDADGSLKIIERLLDRGADIHYRDCTGNTAYSRALFAGSYRIADRLEQAGCTPADMYRNMDTSMTWAAVSDDTTPDDLQELMRRGAPTISEEEFAVFERHAHNEHEIEYFRSVKPIVVAV